MLIATKPCHHCGKGNVALFEERQGAVNVFEWRCIHCSRAGDHMCDGDCNAQPAPRVRRPTHEEGYHQRQALKALRVQLTSKW